MKYEIDWSAFQLGDIILTTSPSIISRLIRSGQAWEEEMGHFDILDALEDTVKEWFDPHWPSHSLYFYESPKKGAEMTFPKTQYCDLNDYGTKDDGAHFITAFRCPYLDDKHNPESASYLRGRLKEWIDDYIKDNVSYGVDNLFAFISPLPENKKHPVCSMWTTLGLIKIIGSEGYDLRFPRKWIIPNDDLSPNVGLVSPYDQFLVLSNLGWGIPFKKFVK